MLQNLITICRRTPNSILDGGPYIIDMSGFHDEYLSLCQLSRELAGVKVGRMNLTPNGRLKLSGSKRDPRRASAGFFAVAF